jgi:hypothetical protein
LSDGLPDGLAQFLSDHVSGYEELEALLFLARSPEQAFTPLEIASSLNVPAESIEAALAALHETGQLVEAKPAHAPKTFRFAPATDRLRLRVAELQLAYVEQRLGIVQVINANALARARTAAARRLAEAFRFDRRKK